MNTFKRGEAVSTRASSYFWISYCYKQESHTSGTYTLGVTYSFPKWLSITKRLQRISAKKHYRGKWIFTEKRIACARTHLPTWRRTLTSEETRTGEIADGTCFGCSYDSSKDVPPTPICTPVTRWRKPPADLKCSAICLIRPSIRPLLGTTKSWYGYVSAHWWFPVCLVWSGALETTPLARS